MGNSTSYNSEDVIEALNRLVGIDCLSKISVDAQVPKCKTNMQDFRQEVIVISACDGNDTIIVGNEMQPQAHSDD